MIQGVAKVSGNAIFNVATLLGLVVAPSFGADIDHLIRIWHKEAKALPVDVVAGFDQRLKGAWVKNGERLRWSGGSEESLGQSFGRFIQQHTPLLDTANRDWRQYVDWLVWCTLEACQRPGSKKLEGGEYTVIRGEYNKLFDVAMRKAQTDLTNGCGELTDEQKQAIEAELAEARVVYAERVRELQDDFLYPGIKTRISEKQRKFVLHDFERLSFYPDCEETKQLMVRRNEAYLQQVKQFINQMPNWVLFGCLVTEVRPKMEQTKWWGKMLLRALTSDGFWPGFCAIRKGVSPPSTQQAATAPALHSTTQRSSK